MWCHLSVWSSSLFSSVCMWRHWYCQLLDSRLSRHFPCLVLVRILLIRRLILSCSLGVRFLAYNLSGVWFWSCLLLRDFTLSSRLFWRLGVSFSDTSFACVLIFLLLGVGLHVFLEFCIMVSDSHFCGKVDEKNFFCSRDRNRATCDLFRTVYCWPGNFIVSVECVVLTRAAS